MKFELSAAVLLLFTQQHAGAFSLGAERSASSRVSVTQLFAEKPRVVITGLGVVNGCGIGHEDFFKACLDGVSSIDVVKRFDASYMPCSIASEIPDEMFDPNDFFINPKNIKSNDRYTHLAVAAARQALKDAGLGDTPDTLEDPKRIGVMVGTAFGGMETFEQQTLKLAKNPTKPKVRSRYRFPGENGHLVLRELSPFCDRCLHLPFLRFWETRRRVSLELSVDVRVPTTELRQHVLVEVMPLVKPWE